MQRFFNEAFLEDEVRNGFYVPAVMKQCWSAELTVLEELKDVCEKLNIRYFADWGTLLGAVRHAGFVPWDDDMDVLMLREDYNKLLEAWETKSIEFPEGFEVRSFRNRPELLEFHGVVVGSNRISFERAHLEKFHGFPYISAIDIFVLDHKSTDPEKQANMAKNALFTIAVADEIREGSMRDAQEIRQNLEKIAKFPGVVTDILNPELGIEELPTALYCAVEEQFSQFEVEESGKLTQNIPRGVRDPEYELELADFVYSVELPFEYETVSVAAGYDRLLTRKYGAEYLNIVKGGGSHGYPYFAEQQKKLFENADFEIPRFKYNKGAFDIINDARLQNKKDNWKTTVADAFSEAERLLENGLLPDLNDLLIDIGNYIEGIKGEGTEAVRSLEKACEAVYYAYNEPSEERIAALAECFTTVSAELEKLLAREEVVFVCFNNKYWNRMKSFYESECAGGDKDVYVVPIPYHHKKYDGTVIDTVFEPESYPEGLEIWNYNSFDIGLHNPDRIYINFPYDNWNPVMDTDSRFYASELAGQTKKLIYVPWFKTDDFKADTYPDMVNMQYYALTPGVVYADEVFVDSECQKCRYVEKLTEFAGEETAENWETKIKVFELTEELTKPEKKKLLYYVSISLFSEHGESAVDKVADNIKIFEEARDKISVDLLLDQEIINTLPKISESIAAHLRGIIDEAEKQGIVNILDGDSEIRVCDYAGYYGDAGPLVRRFIEGGKPVMKAQIIHFD